MRNQTPQSIVEALESGWLLRHGYPVSILSDQGPNVDGHLVRQLCQQLGIRKLHSTPYHPQGDGEAERSIQSFKQSMQCQLAEKGICRTDWPKLLQEITFIHNAQINASTGVTPNEVMFGTRLRTKVDAALPLAETENVTNPREYWKQRGNRTT